MNIEITVEWIGGRTISDVDRTDSMEISGLDFKLKNADINNQDFEIKTSANITGKMNMRNKAPGYIRTYLREAWDLLHDDAWKAAFPGDLKDPEAFVHALQFMDYKLGTINLSTDATATL